MERMATPIGELLKEVGLLDDMQLNSALAHQRRWGGRLGDILVDQGFVDEITMFQAIAHQNGTQLVSIPTLTIAPEVVQAIPQALCERHTIFPLRVQSKVLYIAADNPKNVAAIDEVQFHTRMRVQCVVSPTREIEWAIRRWFHGEDAPCPPPKKKVVQTDEFKLTDASGATIQKSIEQIRQEAIARGELNPDGSRPAPRTGASGYSPSNPPADPFGGAQTAYPPPQNQHLSGAFPAYPSQAPVPIPGAVPVNAPQYVTHEQFHVLQKSLEGIQQVLRFLIDTSMQKGLFTREEYLAYIEQLRRGG